MTRKVHKGQIMFSEVEKSTRPPVDLKQRKAVGGILKPEFFGYTPEDFGRAGPEDLELVSPDNLRKSLFPEKGRFSINGVALNESEYRLFPRNVESLGKAVVAQTLAARLDSKIGLKEAAAQRSQRYAFEQKVERLKAISNGLYQEQSQLLRLKKEARSPGYSHMNTAQIRELSVWIWQNSFKNILHVAGNEQRWSPDQRERSEAAMAALMLWGAQRQRVSNLRQMLNLAISYNQARQGLSRFRTVQLSRKIERIKLTQESL